MTRGYCSVDDVRRVLRKRDLPGDAAQEPAIVEDAITGRSEWLEKSTKRHWYDPSAADSDLIPNAPRTRSDEEPIPTPAAESIDGVAAPRISHEVGDRRYARVRLARRHAQTLLSLEVLDDTGYTDWVSDSGYSAGRGEDYYLQVNNSGVSELYLDVTNLYNETEDEWLLDRWANALYLEFEFGDDVLPDTVRRGVAHLAAAELAEDAVVEIPANAEVYNVATLADELTERGKELLEVYLL